MGGICVAKRGIIQQRSNKVPISQSDSKMYTKAQALKVIQQQVACLKLVYQDLAARSESKIMQPKTLQIFFRMNPMWGASLTKKFNHQNTQNKLITQQMFVQAVLKNFKGCIQQKMKFLFDLYDLDKSNGISFNQLLAILLNSPQDQLKQILRKDEFIKRLTCQQMTYYLSASKKLDQKEFYQQYRSSLTLFPHLAARKKSVQIDLDLYLNSTKKQNQNAQIQNQGINESNVSVKQQKNQREQIQQQFKSKVYRSVHTTELLKKYTEYIFLKIGLDKEKDEISFEKFKYLIKKHPKIYDQCFEGFHQHLWLCVDGTPNFKKLTPMNQDYCAQYSERKFNKIYLVHIKSSLIIFESEEMKKPLQIKNLEGLIVQQIQKQQGYGFLLRHQDNFYPQAKYIFPSKDIQQKWLISLSEFQQKDVFKRYKIEQKIGKGSFCHVYKCSLIQTGEKRAIKIIEKNNRTPQQIDAINRQSEILATCVMPHVVRAYERYQTRNNIYLITQLIQGGTLYEHVKKNGRKCLKEGQAKSIMKDLLETIKIIHQIGIIHRDLKLQNILMKYQEGKQKAKIIDFGLALFKIDLINMDDKLKFGGTPNFVPPQVFLHEEYNENFDIFSLGVIMHFMLTGVLPFNGKNFHVIKDLTLECYINFQSKRWIQISENAKDLISQMICSKNNRIDAQSALKHQWFSQNSFN